MEKRQAFSTTMIATATLILLVAFAGGTALGDDLCADVKRGTSANDRLIGNECVNTLIGKGGDDLIRGLRGPDDLRGGGDKDEVYGGRGGDRVLGGTGRDALYGGPGDDRIKSMDLQEENQFEGNPDRVRCGPGEDTVDADVSDRGRVSDDCENVSYAIG